MLLQRFLDPTPDSGNIIIDNLELRQIPHSTIRKRIIALPQSPFLLTDGSTVRDNLQFNVSRHVSATQDEENVEILQMVGLWDFIQKTGGLTSELRANSLSYGQKQLFCLARAVLRKRICDRLVIHHSKIVDSPVNGLQGKRGILILDEFNAGVDNNTDKLMQSVIDREFSRYTVLCVAHKLEQLMDYDRVAVMEEGEITEVGNPRELLRMIGSKFRDLWFEGRAENDSPPATVS